MSTTAIDSSSTALASYTSSTSGELSLGTEDFLTLLVAQLENQDPLEPQDNTEFISQLAEFSALSAQTETNDKLDELIEAQSNSEQTAAFSLLGQDVVVASDSLYLQGNSLELGFSIDEDAASADITITDDSGDTVASFSISNPNAGDNYISWDGTDANGNSLDSELYNIDIDVSDSDGEALSYQSLVKVRVDEVGIDSSGSILVTDAGNIPLSGISSVVAQ